MDLSHLSTDTLPKWGENIFSQNDSITQSILQNQDEILSQLNKIPQNDNSVLFLILGAILGLLLTLLWNYIMTVKKNRLYRNKLKKYEGLYLAYNKYEIQDNAPFRCFELKLDQNKFKIINGISLLGYEDYTGEINMLEYNLNFGNGYFQHRKSPDNFIGFGFLEIQLTENEILVHETIYNSEGRQNSDPYRWIKQNSKNRDGIVSKHRETQKQKYKSKYEAYL